MNNNKYKNYWALRSQVEEWLTDAKSWRAFQEEQCNSVETKAWDAKIEAYNDFIRLLDEFD